MESAIISLISMAIILTGTVTLVRVGISAVDSTSASWQEASNRDREMRGTDIDVVGVSVGGGGADVQLTVGNVGDIHLRDFSRWDVIVQYSGSDNNYYIKRLAYSEGGPSDNQWTLTGIYLNAASSTVEIFEPSILNPQEEALFDLKLSPVVKVGSTNLVSVVTGNGTVATKSFDG